MSVKFFHGAVNGARHLLQSSRGDGGGCSSNVAAMPAQGLTKSSTNDKAEVLAEPTDSDKSRLVALFNSGRFAELENEARLLIGQYPTSGFAWSILGGALHMQGKDVLPVLEKTAELTPHHAAAHNNLGGALKASGRIDEAIASFERALAINPDLAQAHNNLGIIFHDLGQHDRALKSLHRAQEIDPHFADAHYNLGNTLRDLEQLEKAVNCYRRALEIQPDFVKALSNLGRVLGDLGQSEQEVECYRRALIIDPELAEVHFNLGNSLKGRGQPEEAAASYQRALKIKPDFVKALSNLGGVLGELGQSEQGIECYRRALIIDPEFAQAHFNLGNCLKDRGQLQDALASYQRALEVKPDFMEAMSSILFSQNFLYHQPTEILMAQARRFGDMVLKKARPYVDWTSSAETDRCLRVGLVSGDLKNHPVGYFLEGVMAALRADFADRLEIFVYLADKETDDLTERIKACCHAWHCVAGLSDEKLAGQIHDAEIDILIDLSGHTDHNRLSMFAWKPAPVQASWLGYFATTGVGAIDYLIADSWTLPKSEEVNFTEKIWRLPETRLCFSEPKQTESTWRVSALPALTNQYITFGCFNNLTKMNDVVVALWSRVLAAVPGSRLFLKAYQLKEASVRQETIERFAAHGIGSERLILEGPNSREAYFSAYHKVDIALDPFPYTGGTTSAESLWMGVPVLTLAGERFLARQGVGLMMNAGLSEWVACDADDYVARAKSHAGDVQRLAALRGGLRQQVLDSPLFDAPRFAKHFEAALRDMWRIWCHQRKQSQP